MNRTPESLRQARRWDETAARYRTHGLDPACAAQLAWGHQVGFSQVRPVCDECERELLGTAFSPVSTLPPPVSTDQTAWSSKEPSRAAERQEKAA